jgi:pilus biogenesis lipoprotein CpaD
MKKLAIAALLLLSACNIDPSKPPLLAEDDYRVKHPLSVEHSEALIQVRGPLSIESRNHLRDFASTFIRKGSGALEVSSGARGADDADAKALAESIGQSLLDEGIKVEEIRLQLVIGDVSTPWGTATLRFNDATVKLPDCRDWSEGSRNATHANFGCAQQRNVGMMLADPRDLEQMHGWSGNRSVNSDRVIDRRDHGVLTWSVPLPFYGSGKVAGEQVPQQ